MVSECNFKFNAKYSGRYITTEVSIYFIRQVIPSNSLKYLEICFYALENFFS